MSPSRPFLAGFMLLTLFSGTTIGMAKILTTLYAIHLGASSAQLGVIAAMESLGMLLLTLPAGFVIARYGARRVYFLASLGPLLLNLAIPLCAGWLWLAGLRLLIGLCIPFRLVAMSSAFLERLRHIGNARAGWYRGALMLGMGLLGPLLGNRLSDNLGYGLGFGVIAACFGLMALYSLGFWNDAPTTAATPHAEPSMLGQARQLLAHAEIAESCLVELFCGATSSLFSTFIILLAIQQAGLSPDRAVSLVMVQGVVLVLGLFSLGAHVQRSGLRGTYLQGLGLAVFGLALVGSGHSYLAYALGGASLSLAMALLHLLNMGQLAAQAQDKSRIAGLFNLAGLLGSCSGALLGGAVAQWIGLGNLFLAWIPLLLLAALACRLRRGTHEPLPEG